MACELIAGESQDLKSTIVVFIIQLGKLGIICCDKKFNRILEPKKKDHHRKGVINLPLVKPHLLATLTTMRTDPLNDDMLISLPSMSRSTQSRNETLVQLGSMPCITVVRAS